MSEELYIIFYFLYIFQEKKRNTNCIHENEQKSKENNKIVEEYKGKQKQCVYKYRQKSKMRKKKRK